MNRHLLHIDSSLRTDASRSRKLSAYYADAWRAAHPDGTVTYRDLAADPLPHLDETAFTANFVPAEQRTSEQRAAREITDVIVGEVLAADTIVIGMGLYNFGVPSTVKAWFDRIVVPGVTLGEDGGALGGHTLVFTTAPAADTGLARLAKDGITASRGSGTRLSSSGSATPSSSAPSSPSPARAQR